MKKTLTFGFGRRPQQNFQIFLHISSSLDKVTYRKLASYIAWLFYTFPGGWLGWVAGDIGIKANSARLG